MVSLGHGELTHCGRDKTVAISQWHFQMHFLECKLMNFKYFTEMCSLLFSWQYVIIGSNNSLVPNRQQAIIWTNVGQVYWRIYSSLGPNELTSEWLNLMAFLGTADSKVHIVHINGVIIAYTLESLSSLTQITHNLQATIYFKKKILKMKHKKVRAPIKLTCQWRWQLYTSLQLF